MFKYKKEDFEPISPGDYQPGDIIYNHMCFEYNYPHIAVLHGPWIILNKKYLNSEDSNSYYCLNLFSRESGHVITHDNSFLWFRWKWE